MPAAADDEGRADRQHADHRGRQQDVEEIRERRGNTATGPPDAHVSSASTSSDSRRTASTCELRPRLRRLRRGARRRTSSAPFPKSGESAAVVTRPGGRRASALLHVLQHRLRVLVQHLLGQHEGRHVGVLGDLLAGEHLLGVLHRLLADEVGQLRHRGVEPSGLDRLDRIDIAVDADDDDLLALAGGERAASTAPSAMLSLAQKIATRSGLRVSVSLAMLAAFWRSQSPGSDATILSPGAAFVSSSREAVARFWPVMLPDRPSMTSTGPLASLPSLLTS